MTRQSRLLFLFVLLVCAFLVKPETGSTQVLPTCVPLMLSVEMQLGRRMQ